MNNEDKFYLELGKRIRRARIEQNLTQQQLADSLSLTRTSITNIERGAQRPLVHTVATIASELKVPVSTIIPPYGPSATQPKIETLIGKTTSPEERKFLHSALKKVSKG
jgi:transcriptional regulator with XRE-family HTH domain